MEFGGVVGIWEKCTLLNRAKC